MKRILSQLLLPLALATAVGLFAPTNAQTTREEAERGDAIAQYNEDFYSIFKEHEEDQDRTTWETVQCDNQTSVRGYLHNYPDGLHSADAQKCLKATGQALRTFQGHTDDVESVAFNPNGKYVISGSRDKTLRLWDVHTGQSLRTFQGHTDTVNSVAFSPDGKYVISGSNDDTLRLWDVHTGRSLRTFQGHTDDVNSVAFSPDGKYVISGSNDDTLRLWDVHTGQTLRTFCGHHVCGHHGWVSSVAFSPDGKHVISGSYDGTWHAGTLRLWDVHTGQALRIFRMRSLVRSVAFSPDGKYVISGSTSIKMIFEYPIDGVDVNRGSDDTLHLWDVQTRKPLRIFQGYDVPSVAFSPDGKYVISGSLDKALILWDVHIGKLLRTFLHTNNAISVAFSSDGKYVISGSSDKLLRLWDVHAK